MWAAIHRHPWPAKLAMLLVFTLLTTVVSAGEFCAVDGPITVITCYVQAVADRDLDSFAKLLSSDYTHANLVHPGMKEQGRSFSIDMMRRMLSDPTKNLVLEIPHEGTLVPGEEHGTWKLENMETRAVFSGTPDKGPRGIYQIETVSNWYIRQVEKPTRHYEIFRQEELQTMDRSRYPKGADN